MTRVLSKKAETSTILLEAAKKVLRRQGYSGLSTRDVAAAAGVPLSQIHYHFGSKQGMVLALFEHLNSQLIDRQSALFHDSALTLSEQWDRACDYLDEDIASGYVRVLQELIAASWPGGPSVNLAASAPSPQMRLRPWSATHSSARKAITFLVWRKRAFPFDKRSDVSATSCASLKPAGERGDLLVVRRQWRDA